MNQIKITYEIPKNYIMQIQSISLPEGGQRLDVTFSEVCNKSTMEKDKENIAIPEA